MFHGKTDGRNFYLVGCWGFFLIGLLASPILWAEEPPQPAASPNYAQCVQTCVQTLIESGTDRYGPQKRPILVSILDVQSLACPENPLPLDEAWRVTRRGRRSPAGANLLFDMPTYDVMVRLSEKTGDGRYADFARGAIGHYVTELVDDEGLFWWGWHRHYDVFKDEMTGHNSNYHEIHAIHDIDWELLWQVDPQAVRREIEAIWRLHVIDKNTGEINRHADGGRGCDFSMSAGAFIQAFAFLYSKTRDEVWLDRARLLARYYWDRRDPVTNMIPERPNAGRDRFDGGAFVTAVVGPYCYSLMRAYQLSDEPMFCDQALAYLKAYAQYGYDEKAERFWGSLHLDGSPIEGPRTVGDYAQYEPRGYLELWEPYIAGYQHPIHAAQSYALAYELTKDPQMLQTAERFARWIESVPTTEGQVHPTWYDGYSEQFGRFGTYADKYGRAIAFYVHLYRLTGKGEYLTDARRLADETVEKLFTGRLFRGHPAKPYYEAVDGVGMLMAALLDLDAAGEGE